MKKISAILLALVMMLSMVASAATITITNTDNNRTYNAYKIFDLDITNNTYTYTIDADSEWKSVVEGYNGVKLTLLEDGSYRVDTTEDFDADDFAALIGQNLTGKTVTSKSFTDGNQAVFADMDAGYYYIDSNLGSLVILDTTDISVADKNDDPKIEKTASAEDEDAENVQIGDTLDYVVTITATGAADSEYVVYEKMTAGLTFGNDIVVKNGTTTLTEGTDYSVSTDTAGYTFVLTLTETYTATLKAGDKITIAYSATVNENAVADTKDTNTVSLKFDEDATTVTKTTEHVTDSFDLSKTRSDNTILDGAEFTLYDDETDTAVALVEVDGGYRVASANDTTTTTTIKVGQATITGLDAEASYYLVEIKAPEGYNKVEGNITVVMGDAVMLEDVYQNGGVQVVNLMGSELPSTGGMGTTLFYVVGGLMMAAAVVLLVSKKKVNA